ncbi:conserved protein of unknown function [Burkholderia multivorans]
MVAALKNMKAPLSVLADDPGGAVWIIATINVLPMICGFRRGIWRAMAFRILVCVQLLIVPTVAVIGFHYAIRPPA